MKELPDLRRLSSDEKDDFIRFLWDHVQKLELRVKELETQLSKTSRNSSKPPSSDGLKRGNPKSRREKSGLIRGGQKGHAGVTLEQVEEPDRVEVHEVKECEHCGESLKEVSAEEVERRQVFDFPPLKLEVTEHQCESKSCPRCGEKTRAKFPNEAERAVQYGPQLKALAVYLNQYQLLPFQRTKELIFDLFGHTLSEGTLVKVNEACFERLQGTEERIKASICQSEVVHFDETGVRVEAKTWWLHSASTPTLTYYGVHERRGSEAMNALGILPEFGGIAVHDHWKPYFQYECAHALCNAHHLRELISVHEEDRQAWAKRMIELLLEAKVAVETSPLDCATTAQFEKRYDHILRAGFRENPTPIKSREPGKRGREKQSTPKNLLDRLRNYKPEVLAFLSHPLVPFDNNQGERDIRMTKVQQKISGSFRSRKGAQIFCRIRGYISTVRKNSINVMDAIVSIFVDQPIFPGAE